MHNTRPMPRRLILALALSLAVHGAAFLPDFFKRLPNAAPRPALQALLRLPPAPEPPPAEPLLKNTLDAEAAPEPIEPPPEPIAPRRKPEPKPAAKNTQKRDLQIAQRKLSEQQFYPPEAIARNLEGEVRLIIRLAENGAVVDVDVAVSSGHAILDNAAIRAAYAMGSLTGVTARELILPVIFQLQ
ncbi:MAG: TonB family protein [Propionivibrio sp.]